MAARRSAPGCRWRSRSDRMGRSASAAGHTEVGDLAAGPPPRPRRPRASRRQDGRSRTLRRKRHQAAIGEGTPTTAIGQHARRCDARRGRRSRRRPTWTPRKIAASSGWLRSSRAISPGKSEDQSSSAKHEAEPLEHTPDAAAADHAEVDAELVRLGAGQRPGKREHRMKAPARSAAPRRPVRA